MIKKTLIVALIGLTIFSCKQEKKSKLTNDDEKASYALGLSFAQSFKPQGLDKSIDLETMIQAMKDKFENKPLLFSEDSIQIFLSSYMQKNLEKVSERNLKESKKFLEKNKTVKGIKVTPSGLQYKVEKEGAGAKPANNDIVSVNYVLKTIDGTVIEDSKKSNQNKPVEIPLDRVVPGWQEGLKLMSKGAKYTLFIPSDIAYGENGPAGPNQALIFDVELIDFKPNNTQNQGENQQQQITPEQMEQIKKQAAQSQGK